MDAFKRVLKYVWPQWHRLVVIGISVVIIGILFSASFLTIIPLLKVMMGQEGMHGWADRKISKVRYGMDFNVPERIELSDPSQNVLFYLSVGNVKDKKAGAEAGLEAGDRILAITTNDIETQPKMTRLEMLKALSIAPVDKELNVAYMRPDKNGIDQLHKTVLSAAEKPFYIDYIHEIMKKVPQQESKTSKYEAVKFIIILMILATVGRCVARFLQGYLAEKVVRIAVSDLREVAFEHMINMPLGYFASEGPGDSVSRLIRDTDAAGRGIKTVIGKALREPVKAMFTLGTALFLNWQIVLIFMCGLPVIVAAVNALGKKIKKATKKSLMGWSRMLSKLEETMAGLSVVKVYNRQDYENDTFKKINRSVLKQNLKISKVDTATGPIMEVLGMLAGSAGLLFALKWVFNESLDEAEFFTLLVLIGTTAESLRKTSDVWNRLQGANAAAERVFAVIDEPREKEEQNPSTLTSANQSIEFRDIVFTYPKAQTPVLKGVNLKVQAGQNVAIVGPNGSGKSTLLNLLPRFYDADSGQILIDGHDNQKVTLNSLREHIALVTQKVITFNDTIAANIAYSKPDATMDEVIEASKKSYAHEFIEQMPDGYNTVIGEHGSGLSGGQLQRIVIARAILKNPDILIFDEAMSQVDADSEAKIHKALEELTHNRTSFVIAHRFSTVVNSDKIVVLENGEIIASGTHDELIKDCLLYKKLYETQLM